MALLQHGRKARLQYRRENDRLTRLETPGSRVGDAGVERQLLQQALIERPARDRPGRGYQREDCAQLVVLASDQLDDLILERQQHPAGKSERARRIEEEVRELGNA